MQLLTNRFLARFTAWLNTDYGDPTIWVEKRICLARWLGLVIIIPTLLIMQMESVERWELFGVVIVSLSYDFSVPWLIEHQRKHFLYIITLCDAVAVAAFVYIAGFDTPFYMIFFPIITADSMRLGLVPALQVVAIVAALDFGSHLIGGNENVGAFFFRTSFLILTAVLSAALYLFAKRGEAVLRQANDQLQAANRELVKLNRMKGDFVSNVSHELRTPLASIRSFSEFLAEDPSMEEETRVEFAHIINVESERLTRLVNNLLDLSVIEAGKLELRLQPLDLRSELEELVQVQRPVSEAKGLTLALNVAPHLSRVVADADALHQVLLNLTGNAIKFTERGEVRVQADVEGQQVVISVADTGPGIGPDEQQMVFDRFFQGGDMLTSKPSGTGLGLAICRDILRLHGTDLRLDSTLGRGSTFSFALPIAP